MEATALSCICPATPHIRPARNRDSQRVIDTLTLAFAADPAVRWLYPDPQQYLCHFPVFAKAFGGGAIAGGTAYLCEEYTGAALWLPPHAASDEEALMAHLEESVSEREKATAYRVFEEMAGYHPQEPHWYLALIGVEPRHQGRGYGSALMEQALRRCDQSHLPAYLESSDPRNIAFYERHGFRVVGEVKVGDCPPITPMLRPARAYRV